MPTLDTVTTGEGAAQIYRLDLQLRDRLRHDRPVPPVLPGRTPETLPDPVFPQVPPDADESYDHYSRMNRKRAIRSWAVPYAKSRWYAGELRPLVPYLFTEWKCNLDCHYCWAFDNRVKGMTEDVAKRSIDWLHSIGARALPLMGGEPLLRPKFLHKIIYYAAKKDFFVYVPTNGRLMKPDVIDRLGDAGMATVNLAVDCVGEKPGLPKSLDRIRPYFEHLLRQQRRYGYTVVLNINVTRINMDDVKALTEIGRDNNVMTDYHINEAPMIEQDHFKHLDENSTYFRPEDYGMVDDLLDYLIDKSRQGYKMVNPLQHLAEMKDLLRGRVQPWHCRAGQNSLIIRTDGTLAPCFPMYSASHDWGTIEAPKFEVAQLDEMKVSCQPHCLSTCNYILGYCYDTMRVVRWLAKQARRGFRGVSGSF